MDETSLMYSVYERLCPRILVCGKPNLIMLAKMAPLFVHKNSCGVALTVESMERWYISEHS